MAMSVYRSVINNKNHCPQSPGREDPQSKYPENDIDFMPENQWLEDFYLIFLLGGPSLRPIFQERNVTLPETNSSPYENPHLSW